MTIASMTAFARTLTQHDWGQLIWEIRSVNHRYLDVSFKIPENMREWEIDWRNLVAKRITRGKIECNATFIPSNQSASTLKINTDLVEKLISNAQVIMQYPGVSPTLKAMDVLHWPEVLLIEKSNISALKGQFTDLLAAALTQLIATREREGQQLVELLESKLAQVMEQVTLVKEKMPQCVQDQKQKILQKIADLQITVDSSRLEQECVFYAQRMDVSEEIERLATHVIEVQRVLTEGAASGRRLDFLMQEMGREANTLGAKAPNSTITKSAVELKVLIEQMREQIQNVE